MFCSCEFKIKELEKEVKQLRNQYKDVTHALVDSGLITFNPFAYTYGSQKGNYAARHDLDKITEYLRIELVTTPENTKYRAFKKKAK